MFHEHRSGTHTHTHTTTYLDISTLDSQTEPCLLVLDKVQSDLGISLLLQVPNDRLPAELRALDDLEHLVVLALGKRHLECVLGVVD